MCDLSGLLKLMEMRPSSGRAEVSTYYQDRTARMTVWQVSSARSVARRDASASQVPRDADRGACKTALWVAYSGLSAASPPLDDVPHRLRGLSYPNGPNRRSDALSYLDSGY
jgi:hypothetical protein